jgi:peptide/nickel transport system ATP-binding protein
LKNLIEIKNLDVRFYLKEGTVHALNGIDLDVKPNKTIGIVGESGCGKSVTARAILRILPEPGRIVSGKITLANGSGGIDLTALDPKGKQIRSIRGADIAMIFQEPMTSLSPVHTVGNQIIEAIRLHRKVTAAEARDVAIETLRLVGLPSPEKRIDMYPYELSGGLRQRCVIAISLACRPRLLIADEPTTALDVTIQRQILDLMKRLQAELDMAIMMITHDLGVIAETADEVAIMYMGRIVEQGSAEDIFHDPKHPYTQGLLESVPKIGTGGQNRLQSIPGSVPGPFSNVAGCPFHPRCSQRMEGVCDAGPAPVLMEIGSAHKTACRLYDTKEAGD